MKRLLIDGNWNADTNSRARWCLTVMPDKFYMVSVDGPLTPNGKCEWNFIRLRKDGMKAKVIVNATLREMADTEMRTRIIDVADRDLTRFLEGLPKIEEFIMERLGSSILMLES